jgi:choline kinase
MVTPSPSFVILAAGKGTRLGGPVPKPLTELADGRTILQQQLDNLQAVFGESAQATTVVVGYRSDAIVEQLPPGVTSVYNAAYDTSNTAKSLLLALKHCRTSQGVLWMNGDVVFSPLVLGKALPLLEAQQSFMAVVEGPTADEEVKYTLTEEGFLHQVSKTVRRGLGEAVGINYVAPQDVLRFKQALAAVGQQDYFEAAVQKLLKEGQQWAPLPIGHLYAVEVDFAEDLERANEALR